MRDVETGSEWSHLLGEAMAGPLKGSVLKPVVTDMVTWGVWRQQHPKTTVLNMSRMHGGYSAEFYSDPDRFVFGFKIGSRYFALPLKTMQQQPVLHFQAAGKRLLATYVDQGKVIHLFDPEVDGRPLDFRQVDERLMTDQQTGSQWRILDGVCVDGPLKGKMLRQRVGIMSFRKAWQNFHPRSADITLPR